MAKFNRKYELTVETKRDPKTKESQNLIIKLPLTMTFDINRTTFSNTNRAAIEVYNLGRITRNQIRKDRVDALDVRVIELKAGYGDDLTTIFKGNLETASSMRRGVDFITTINAFDAGYASVASDINKQFLGGTTKNAIINSMAGSLDQYGVKVGAIGDTPGNIPRGNSYQGSAISNLIEITEKNIFIDNQKIHILGENEAIAGDILLIDSASGLLGTPVREEQYINFEILFEPKIGVGRIIELKSVTEDHFSGRYLVKSVKHKGMISEVSAGTAVTSVGAIAGLFGQVKEKVN